MKPLHPLACHDGPSLVSPQVVHPHFMPTFHLSVGDSVHHWTPEFILLPNLDSLNVQRHQDVSYDISIHAVIEIIYAYVLTWKI